MNRKLLLVRIVLPITLITCASLLLRSKPESTLLGQNNAVWCQSLFLRGYQPTTKAQLTDSDLADFCDTLNRNRIRYAYMFAGPYDANGYLPDYAFSTNAISSIQTIKRECQDVIILPWVGGIINKTVFVDNPQWVSNAVNDTSRLLKTLGLNGVHINFEFFTYQISDEFYPGLRGIEHYGEDEIRFFRELRAVLPQAFISTVVVSTAPQTKPWKRKNTFEEIREMSKLVNQVAILCYDTSINEQDVFRESYRDQLADIAKWKEPPDVECQFLFGLGTFINKEELWKFRDLEIEGISNTLMTLKNLIVETRPNRTNLVDGLAVFAEWTTDKQEWKELRRHWIKD